LEEKTPKTVKERPPRDKPKPRTASIEAGEKRGIGFSTAAEVQKRPGFDVRIDSKDFASMEDSQIQAFFDGLSRILKETKEQKEEETK
jgi:hypothetical protein